MVEWCSKNNLFKISYFFLLILLVKIYVDKKRYEDENQILSNYKLKSDNGKNSINNNDVLLNEIKQSINELNENLGETNDNLKKYSNLAENIEKYNDELKKLKDLGIKNNNNNDQSKVLTTLAVVANKQNDNNNIKIFDLTKSLEPPEVYSSIQCRKSREIYVSTTLCVHDIHRDIHVSGSIWREGVWEYQIVSPYMDYINKYPEWLVLDVGAQIGQYSLYAAQFGRQVLTVEPFYENVLRLHKAAKTENIGDKITLITNAISNKRGEIKMLQPNSDNIGGQSLVENKNKVITKEDIKADDPNAKYYVETILFDDIVPHLPTKNGKKYEKAIMKIDIEAFEPYAFQHAAKLFDTLDIPIIFMEWGNLPKQHDMYKEIEQMIDFLYNRSYKAYGNNMELNRSNWQGGWAWDIIWKKNGY